MNNEYSLPQGFCGLLILHFPKSLIFMYTKNGGFCLRLICWYALQAREKEVCTYYILCDHCGWIRMKRCTYKHTHMVSALNKSTSMAWTWLSCVIASLTSDRMSPLRHMIAQSIPTSYLYHVWHAYVDMQVLHVITPH